MINITIVVEDESMTVEDGKLPSSRLTWMAAGLSVFVIGSLAGKFKFEQACNLAMNECEARHIPVISLRYQKQQPAKNPSTNIDMYKRTML